MQPVPHERVVDIDDVDDPVVGVELQGADLTAAGSGLAAEQRGGTERARECLCKFSWPLLRSANRILGGIEGRSSCCALEQGSG